jgi:hypothetical protein
VRRRSASFRDMHASPSDGARVVTGCVRCSCVACAVPPAPAAVCALPSVHHRVVDIPRACSPRAACLTCSMAPSFCVPRCCRTWASPCSTKLLAVCPAAAPHLARREGLGRHNTGAWAHNTASSSNSSSSSSCQQRRLRLPAVPAAVEWQRPAEASSRRTCSATAAAGGRPFWGRQCAAGVLWSRSAWPHAQCVPVTA